MHKTKLVKLLSTCSKKQLDGFEKYLNIYLEKPEKIKELYLFLKPFHNDWSNSDLNKDNLQIALNQSLDAKSIGTLNSKLFQYLVEYLVKEELFTEEQYFQKEILVANLYEKRGLHNMKRSRLTRLEKRLSDMSLSAPWDLIHHLKVLELKYYDEEDKIYEASELLVKTINKLDMFANSLKIKYNCELLSRIQFLTQPHLKPLLNASRNTPIDQNSFFQSIYFNLFQAFQTLEDPFFHETFSLLKQSYGRIRRIDRHHILLYLINYAARRSRKNNYIYTDLLFELYKYGVEEDLLLENHSISRIRFHNVVDVACKLNKIAFAKNFVKKYQQYISEDNADHTSYLASLLVLFAEKKFGELQTQFVRTRFKFLDEKFRFKSLEICCFFELENQEKVFRSKCKAFRGFLGRSKGKIGEDFISSYRNFTRIVEKLLEQTVTKSKIQKELDNVENIVLKYWLQEKLAVYRKKY